MRRFFVYTSAVCLLSAPVYAGTAKRIDPFIKKAIQDTAAIQTDTTPELITPEPLLSNAETGPVSLDADSSMSGFNEARFAVGEEEVPPLPGPDGFAAETEEQEYVSEKMVEDFEEETEIASFSDDYSDDYKEEKPSAKAVMGYKMGSFRLLPSITLQSHYDDNVRTDPTTEIDDIVLTTNPVLRVELEDSDHEIMVEGAYKGEVYSDTDDEDTHDFYVRSEGKFKLGEKVFMPFELGFVLGHEKREDDLTRQLPTDRTQTEDVTLGGGLEYKVDNVGIAFLGKYVRERFDDGSDSVGAQVIRRDADRATWEGTGKLSVDLEGNKTVYVSGTVGTREYKRRNFQGGGFNGAFRDGDFYEARAGVVSRYDNFVVGDINIGYKSWDHDDASLTDVDDMVVNANLSVNFDENTVLGIKWARDFYEDDEVVNTIRRTESRISLDHEFHDKYSIGTAVTYLEDKFEQSTREDDTYGLSLYGGYEINDNFTAGLEYVVDSRDSSGGSAFEYDRQRYMARITGRL